MKQHLRQGTRKFLTMNLPRISLLFLLCFTVGGMGIVNAQKKPKGVANRSVDTSVPNDYKQVGNTLLYYRQSSGSIDFIGCFDGKYYSSTYSDNGFRVAMQVGSNSAQQVDCLNGTTFDGVTFTASVEQQGELARICYNVFNANEKDTTVSLGIYADIKIGNNDAAPISRRIDTMGETYGLTLKDGNGAQLCALFGSGLKGVAEVDDFWFGHYSQNNFASAMVGNYTQGNNYMVENGSYDSGMGICWKDRIVPAGKAVTFSWLIGVGDVNLEPSSSFEVTPDDPEGWNDLSLPHRLTLEGEYESPAGLDGMIEYAVENNEEWLPLTDTLSSGDEFTASLVAEFDVSLPTHTIRFRTVDNVGNATMLPPIVYADVSFVDVSGIEEKTYTGDSLYQSSLKCGIADTCYKVRDYRDNVDAGTASFAIEGVFPYSIGRKRYAFTIHPAPLQGEIQLSETDYVYSGKECLPEWTFVEDRYASLVEDEDYVVVYEDNLLPGIGRVSVNGTGNYTGEMSAEFIIDKAPLSDGLYQLVLPDEDISYDGKAHEATIECSEGVGVASISYTKHSEDTTLATVPREEGAYDIYLEIADGTLYYGRPRTFIGTFSIYKFDEAEWASLSTLYADLAQNFGWTPMWDFSQGSKAIGSFKELQVEKGHIVGIDLSGKGLTGLFPMSVFAFTKLSSLNLSLNGLAGDLSTAMLAVVGQNPVLTANISSLDITGNRFKGNVGLLARCFPGLTTLRAANNAFEDVFPMVSPNVSDLDISCQKMSRVVNINMSTVSVADVAKLVPTILLYDHANQTFKTDINLLCTVADPSAFDMETDEEWAMQLSFSGGQLSIPYVSKQNAYHGASGDEVNIIAMNEDGTIEGSTFKVAMSFVQGDANFVQGVDASDLQATILYAFGDYLHYPFNFTAADTYKDGKINVQDVVCTANILLTNTAAVTAKAKKAAARLADEGNAEAHVYIKDGKVILNARKPVAAICVRMSGNVEWDIERYGLIQATSKNNMVGYSLTGATLPMGETVIGTCPFGAEVEDVSMADAEAHAISVAIDGHGITSIGTVFDNEDGGNVQMYDLSGRRADKLQSGVNIIVKGGRSIKVIKNKDK